MNDQQPDKIERFFGAGITAVGALIFALCGLCTLWLTGRSLLSLAHYPAGLAPIIGSLLLFAFVGGLPTLLGFMLMRLGWKKYRGALPRSPEDGTKTFDE